MVSRLARKKKQCCASCEQTESRVHVINGIVGTKEDRATGRPAASRPRPPLDDRCVLPTNLSVVAGDVIWLDGRWYVTHAGLLRIARKCRCAGIDVRPVSQFCNPAANRWAFKATVYKSHVCRGFAGFGDADPSNVSPVVRGAEMRVAETRAVNRALRKAYGIGLCSVEEIGSSPTPSDTPSEAKQLRPRSKLANGGGAHPLRDRLCVLIRKHGLDANQVKLYAADFCGTEELRQSSREQIAEFITHLAQYAEHDRGGLICRLNGYAPKPPAPAVPDANQDHENVRGAA